MKKNFLAYIFLITIFSLSILDIIIPDKKFSELENRNLKSKVNVTFKNFLDGSFSKKYDEYVNDQFIGRDYWINLKSRSEYALGKIENNNIIYGKEGYLFEKFTYIDENRLKVNAEAINNFTESIDEDVSLMVVPNSYEIYSEKLPKGAPLINQEEIINELYENSIKSNNINLFHTMKSNKDKYIYYKTDHHWTTYGAYLAYCEFIKSIGEGPIDLKDIEEVKVDVEGFYGTYFSKAKPFNVDADILSYYDFENITVEIEGIEYEGLYDYSKKDLRDKYSLFLRGNNPLTIIKNKKNLNGKRLVVFKDSYANSLIPFLTINYEEIHVIDLRSFNVKVSEYVDENDFDNVLIVYSFTNLTRDANILKIKS